MCVAKPYRSTVVYDLDALLDFLTGVTSKEERKAAFNAVDKLRRVGEALAPPHMKPLQGEANLNELSAPGAVADAPDLPPRRRRLHRPSRSQGQGGLREEETRRPRARAAVRLS
jgi:hypothetical protein